MRLIQQWWFRLFCLCCGIAIGLWGCSGLGTSADQKNGAGISNSKGKAESVDDPSEAEAVAWPEKTAIFYGNVGTWGTLGMGSDGASYNNTPEAVWAKYDERCNDVRQTAGLNDDLRCGADLIVYVDNDGGFFIKRTQRVAEGIIARGGRVWVNFRTPAEFTYEQVHRLVRLLFHKDSTVFTPEFLANNDIGLSLDFETNYSQWGPAPADMTNQICRSYVELMKTHKPQRDARGLSCLVYEYGLSVLVNHPEQLDANIFPVMMSIYRGHDAVAQKAAATAANRRDYANSYFGAGCMLFTENHLVGQYQRDEFSLAQGLSGLTDACDVLVFQ